LEYPARSGKPEESRDLLGNWLEEHHRSAEGGAMYGHVQWHLALAEWQLGLAEQAWQRDERYCAPETTRCGPVLTLADCGGFLLREYLRTGATRPVSAAVSALSERFGAMLSHVPQPHSFHSAASCRYSGISRRSRLAGAMQGGDRGQGAQRPDAALTPSG